MNRAGAGPRSRAMSLDEAARSADDWLDGLRDGDPRAVQAADRLLAHMSVVSAQATLTARQTEVLGLVAEGLSKKEIARELWLSEETVKFHMKWVLLRLNARNSAQAVATAFRLGLID